MTDIDRHSGFDHIQTIQLFAVQLWSKAKAYWRQISCWDAALFLRRFGASNCRPKSCHSLTVPSHRPGNQQTIRWSSGKQPWRLKTAILKGEIIYKWVLFHICVWLPDTCLWDVVLGFWVWFRAHVHMSMVWDSRRGINNSLYTPATPLLESVASWAPMVEQSFTPSQEEGLAGWRFRKNLAILFYPYEMMVCRSLCEEAVSTHQKHLAIARWESDQESQLVCDNMLKLGLILDALTLELTTKRGESLSFRWRIWTSNRSGSTHTVAALQPQGRCCAADKNSQLDIKKSHRICGTSMEQNLHRISCRSTPFKWKGIKMTKHIGLSGGSSEGVMRSGISCETVSLHHWSPLPFFGIKHDKTSKNKLDDLGTASHLESVRQCPWGV